MRINVTKEMNNNDIDRLLSIDQAAELLSISPWTLRKMISSKKLRSAKLGTRRLVPKSEITRLIKESMGEPLS
jgi:excisionase family DNA binding protein